MISFATGTGGPLGIILSKWFAKRRGVAMGAVMAGGSIGSLFFIPLLTFIALNYSWQLAWIVVGLFGMIFVVPLSIVVLKNEPKDIISNSNDLGSEVSESSKESGPLWVDKWTTAYNSKPYVAIIYRIFCLWNNYSFYLCSFYKMGNLKIYQLQKQHCHSVF